MKNSTASVSNGTDPTIQANGDEDDASLSTTDITAIALGCLFFLCAFFLLVLLISFKKKKFFLRKSKNGDHESQGATANENSSSEHIEIPPTVQPTSVVTFQGDKEDMNTKKSVGAFQKHYRSMLRNPSDFVKEFKHLKDWSSKRNRKISSIGQSAENLWKNRDPKAVPDNRYLVSIVDDANPYGVGGYINASYIDGHNRSKEYITTQLPYQSTQDDFWTMVYQEHAQQIVALCNFAEENQDFSPFWKNVGPTANFEKVRVRMYQQINGEFMTTYKIKIQDVEGDDYVLDCTLIEFNLDEQLQMNNVENIYLLVEKFRHKKSELQKRLVPSIILCSNGVQCSGAFVAMCILLDQAEADHLVNIPGVVRSIRKFRPSFITQAQYRLCYDVMARFLDRRCQISSLQQG